MLLCSRSPSLRRPTPRHSSGNGEQDLAWLLVLLVLLLLGLPPGRFVLVMAAHASLATIHAASVRSSPANATGPRSAPCMPRFDVALAHAIVAPAYALEMHLLTASMPSSAAGGAVSAAGRLPGDPPLPQGRDVLLDDAIHGGGQLGSDSDDFGSEDIVEVAAAQAEMQEMLRRRRTGQ